MPTPTRIRTRPVSASPHPGAQRVQFPSAEKHFEYKAMYLFLRVWRGKVLVGFPPRRYIRQARVVTGALTLTNASPNCCAWGGERRELIGHSDCQLSEA